MRRWMKVGCGVLGTAAALLVGLVTAAPALLGDRVVAALQEQIDANVDASVGWDTMSLSVLSTFPSLGVSVDGLTVTGKGPFDGVDVARVEHLLVQLDLLAAVRGEVVVEGLEVEDAAIRVIADEQGRMNTDIVRDSGEPTAGDGAATPLTLRRYDLKKVDFTYEDRQGGLTVEVKGLDHGGKGHVTGDTLVFSTRTDIADLTVKDGAVTLLRNARVGADLDVERDQRTGKLTFGDNRVTINELDLAFSGSIAPVGANTELDLAFEAKQTTFKSVLSLVPSVYAGDFSKIDATGTLALQGSVKGRLVSGSDELPAFDLALQVHDGRFRQPDLPVGIDDVQVDLVAHHPGGIPDLVEVDVKQARLSVEGSPLSGSLKLRHPTTDPDVDLKLKGNMDLARLRAALPEQDLDLQGHLTVDAEVMGRASAFEASDLDHVQAKGLFRLTNFVYRDPDIPDPVTIERLDLTMNPRRADLAELTVRIGTSDIQARGSVDNAIAWFMSDDAVLGGSMDVRSRYLDLDRLSGGDSEPTTATDTGVWIVPDDMNLTLTANVARARYDGKNLKDLQSRVVLSQGVLDIQTMSMKTLGGRLTVKGTYAANTTDHADVDLNIEGGTFAVAETVGAFDTLQRIAPVAKSASGHFRSTLHVKTRVKGDYSPDLETLITQGRITTDGVAVQPQFMEAVAKAVKSDKFDRIDLGSTEVGFRMKGGRLDFDPVKLKVAGQPATLTGSTGPVDQSLDLELAIKLPIEMLGATGAVPDAVGKGKVDFVVGVGGTWDQPKVTTNIADLARGAVAVAAAVVVEEVKGVASDAAARLIAEAKEQGDRLVAETAKKAQILRDEAKKAGSKLRAEAKQEGDKLVKKAKGNAVAEAAAKEAAKKLEKEADKKADKLEKEADKKADSLVDEAKKQRDRLISEAEAQAAKLK